MLPLTGDKRTFPADQFVFMATAMGTVKKTALDEFSNPRKAGIIAVNLDEGDYLIGAALTDGEHDVMLFRTAARPCVSTKAMSVRWAATPAAYAA